MISCSSSSRVRRLPSLLVDDGLLRVAGDQPVLLGNPRMLLRLVRSADRLAADRVAAVFIPIQNTEHRGVSPYDRRVVHLQVSETILMHVTGLKTREGAH